ncbi:hypothetical protein VNI00_014826 [Paramarasmius palmivorus]|uniref:Uncharacterized protein n=1 Tax=Paramarasmius palmivorus TaxID=297713 RepID=A0AAW0BRV4_9AGAR
MTLGLQDTIGRIQPLRQFSGVKKLGMTDRTTVESPGMAQAVQGGDADEPQDPRKAGKDPADMNFPRQPSKGNPKASAPASTRRAGSITAKQLQVSVNETRLMGFEEFDQLNCCVVEGKPGLEAQIGGVISTLTHGVWAF